MQRPEIYPGIKNVRNPLYFALQAMIAENGGRLRLALMLEAEMHRPPKRDKLVNISHRTWLKAEKDYIIANYHLITSVQISNDLCRPISTVRWQIRKLIKDGILIKKTMNHIIFPGLDKIHSTAFILKKFDNIEKHIIATVCNHFQIHQSNLTGDSRRDEFTFPRMVAIYLIRKKTPLTWKKISFLFRRDHSTAIYAADTIKDLLSVDKRTQRHIESLENILLLPDYK